LYKQAQNGTDVRLIQNEVKWRKFFDRVVADDVTYTKVIETGNDYIIFEWLEAPFVAEADPKKLEAFRAKIDRYAGLLLAMDEAAEDYNFEEEEITGSMTDAFTSESPEFAEVLKANWITKQDLESVYDNYVAKKSGIELRYQHADFLPWHIFDVNGTWYIYDAEHAGAHKFRFRDLAHSYSRLATIGRRPDLAKQLLSSFLEKSKLSETELASKLMPVIIQRSMGSVMDAFNDLAVVDYRAEAMELFEIVKTGEFSDLLA
jgi:hypothetical protein